jgi:hypothetical protein
MGADRDPGEALGWLLSPPGPGEIHVHVDVGRETRLTPEVQQALNELLRTLEGEDVGGYRLRLGETCTGYYSGPCFKLSVCPDYLGDPCAAYHCQPLSCRICSGLTGSMGR